jgi:hypothetical protein
MQRSRFIILILKVFFVLLHFIVCFSVSVNVFTPPYNDPFRSRKPKLTAVGIRCADEAPEFFIMTHKWDEIYRPNWNKRNNVK